jgi:hypothetical protein
MTRTAILSDTRRSGILYWDTAAALITFSGTLFVSAALLFSLQPMFAKMVLPALGGTPAVWAVSMCFFQVMLLAGYCYAYLLNRFVPIYWAPAVHGLVLVLAVVVLPVGLPASASEPPPGGEYLWLIGVLASGVGLPFFAVSATAPLLQAWFTHTGNPHSADPYFLYGASNVGSLLALVSYPIVIEPLVGLSAQSQIWAFVFIALALMIAACAVQMVRNSSALLPMKTADAASGPVASVAWRSRVHWIACALIPSGLLVAFTSYTTTDIASAPFLWVMPLAVFLATFIIVFRDGEVIPHAVLLDRLPLLAAGLVLITSCSSAFPLPIAFGVSFVAFLAVALVCHRELYLTRPSAQHLTEFYLWMSFGGALGGLFSAILAPHLFTTIFEFPLLAVASLLLSPLVINARLERRDWTSATKMTAAGIGILLLVNAVVWAGWIEGSYTLRLVVLAGLLAVMFSLQKNPRMQLAVLVFMLLAAPFVPEGNAVRYGTRSFFGSLRVMEAEGGAVRFFLHGTTNHGAQRVRDGEGMPIARPVPAQYYHPRGPLAKSVAAARQASGKAPGDFRAGIVGLGIGAVACYARPNEMWRFYEIDPAVVALARDKSQFTYLASCLPDADVVIGDARLTLAKEPSKSFDFLLMDAFSSDAVPTHLLTVEAIRMYLDKLSDRGVLVMHVSNRHLDLISVVLAAAQQIPGVHAVVAIDRSLPQGYDRSPSHAVLITKSASGAISAWPDALPATTTAVKAWTDDYSDVISALWRRYVR